MLTKAQIDIIRHSLGIDERGYSVGNRNYFATDVGSREFIQCESLVKSGHMCRIGDFEWTGGMVVFRVTDEGISEIPKPKPLSRSKKRYQEFLHADSGLTFIEWLKSKSSNPKRTSSEPV